MIAMMGGWAVGIAAFATFLLSLPVAIRLFGGDRRLVEVIVGAALIILAIWVSVFGSTFDRHTFWGFLAIYGVLFISFLQVFAIIYKSISLRMLVEIDHLPGAALSFDATHSSLIVAGAYARRLTNLEAGGFVVRSEESIELTGKGRTAVKWIAFAQNVFGVADSG